MTIVEPTTYCDYFLAHIETIPHVPHRSPPCSATMDPYYITTINDLNYHKLDPSLESQINQISQLISNHLSEPYSIYVYWYFFNQWSHYCYVVSHPSDANSIIGVIISRIDIHREVRTRGYIGMLVIDPSFRNKKIASNLVRLTLNNMINDDKVDEIMLETEVVNKSAIGLYESFGFIKVKRLYRYYINTHDAFRLILPVSSRSLKRIAFLPPLSV